MGIKWREELAIGVEEIDNQHKELLERFDLLLTACKQGKGSEELLYLIDFLDTYVVSHFGDEEKLQRQHNFPDYEKHHLEHEAFIARVKELKDRMYSEGGVHIDHVLDANKMLLDWLLRHVTVKDREIGRYLQKHS